VARGGGCTLHESLGLEEVCCPSSATRLMVDTEGEKWCSQRFRHSLTLGKNKLTTHPMLPAALNRGDVRVEGLEHDTDLLIRVPLDL
jgi:hypothetical protein